jgi:glycosyltransferase involved in cell wall biosynthesis
MPAVSIIIPSDGDGDFVRQRVRELQGLAGVEIILVESGEDSYLSELPAGAVACTLTTPKGRALQMNRGAARARGDILLFLHADCRVRAEGIRALGSLPDRCVGGCFRQRNRFPFASDREMGRALARRAWGFTPRRSYTACLWAITALLRVFELRIRFRTRFLGIVFGDQGIFVRKNVFDDLGGYRNIPLFEDLDFWQRLSARGKLQRLRHAILSEPRRWIEIGFTSYGLLARKATKMYYAGVNPHEISDWFHREYDRLRRRQGLHLFLETGPRP